MGANERSTAAIQQAKCIGGILGSILRQVRWSVGVDLHIFCERYRNTLQNRVRESDEIERRTEEEKETERPYLLLTKLMPMFFTRKVVNLIGLEDETGLQQGVRRDRYFAHGL